MGSIPVRDIRTDRCVFHVGLEEPHTWVGVGQPSYYPTTNQNQSYYDKED